MNVLIIEDNIESADTLSEYLANKGHHCIVANDGKSALEKELSNFDVAILDIDLPGELSGLDIVPILKELRDNILTILVSANDAILYSDESKTTGADFFLTKPIDLVELHSLVEDHKKQFFAGGDEHDFQN